jgi:ribosomal protein L24E
MDILTEIYRIKQVMGLITEQNDNSLVDEIVYDAIKNIESVFSFTDEKGNIIPRPKLTGKEKEQNIKKAIKDTIGLNYWFKIKPKLRGQIYSFMYQADSSENSLYRWLAGLAQSIDPNIERKNIFADKVPKRDANGKIMVDKEGKQIMEILPLDKLTDDKKSNINKAIDTVKKAIDDDKINYASYLNIVKQQYDKLQGTLNDAQNRIKIWEPRPEALDKLMNNESWDVVVKPWWYNKIGEPDPINQVNNASTQKDSASANPNVVQPPINQQQNSTPTNTAQQNTDTPATTTPQVTVQSSEDLDIDSIRDGENGDPYVYIRNKTGDFLTFKCGKKNEKCPALRTNPNTVKWINVSQKVIDNAGEKYVTAEKAIKVSIYKEDESNQAEETTPENDTNSKIKKAFRNKYYKKLIEVITQGFNRLSFSKIARNPCFNNNVAGCKNDYIIVFRKSNEDNNYYKVDLNTTKILYNGTERTPISDKSLNTAMSYFSNNTTSIDIEGKAYKIGGKKQNSIMELSKVFDTDNSEPKHTKNTKVQDLIKGKDFYINEA